MQRILMLLVVGLSISSLAWAGGPACVPGTLASYIALGSNGCSVGIAAFANFGYGTKASGDAHMIPPDRIKVSPGFVPFSVALSFSASWKAANGQTQDAFIKYTVLPASSTSFGVLTLQMGTIQVGNFGTVGVRQTTDVGEVAVVADCVEVCTFTKTDTLQFWPVATLQVIDHVNLISKDGGAALSSFKAMFDLCPLCVQ